jgi:hypothetical protein
VLLLLLSLCMGYLYEYKPSAVLLVTVCYSPDDEHYLLMCASITGKTEKIPIIVYDQEPSSIIAFTLRCVCVCVCVYNNVMLHCSVHKVPDGVFGQLIVREICDVRHVWTVLRTMRMRCRSCELNRLPPIC